MNFKETKWGDVGCWLSVRANIQDLHGLPLVPTSFFLLDLMG